MRPAQQIEITTIDHRVRISQQSLNAQSKKVRPSSPIPDCIKAKQHSGDVALRGALNAEIMRAKHHDPPLNLGLARMKTTRKTTKTV